MTVLPAFEKFTPAFRAFLDEYEDVAAPPVPPDAKTLCDICKKDEDFALCVRDLRAFGRRHKKELFDAEGCEKFFDVDVVGWQQEGEAYARMVINLDGIEAGTYTIFQSKNKFLWAALDAVFCDAQLRVKEVQRKEAEARLPSEKLADLMRRNVVITKEPAPVEGVKHDDGKLPYDLLPPRALRNVVEVLGYGARKYTPENWRKVPDAEKRYVAAAMRHLEAYRMGERLDPESDLPHLAHAACSLLFVLELEAAHSYGSSK